MSESMCNLFGSLDKKHMHLDSIRIISNAFKIQFGATSNTFFPNLHSCFSQVESARSPSSSCCAASLAWQKGLQHPLVDATIVVLAVVEMRHAPGCCCCPH
jgi:hypothetical protein